MKSYRFFFHYNKPASLAAGEPRLSVHYRGVCHIVERIACMATCVTKINKRQPRVVMAGSAERVEVCGGLAIIE